MATELSRGTLFTPQLTNEVFNLVSGQSAIVKLSNQKPLPFNGKEMFTFTFDNEIDVVAENGKKTHGGITYEPIKMTPVKVEYGARISDEFMYASEEYQLNVLKNFNEGFAKKLARGLDLMALHGINPRTGEKSVVIGENYLVGLASENKLEVEDVSKPIELLETATSTVTDSDKLVTGMALAPSVTSAIGKITTPEGIRVYPQFMFGATPDNLNGIRIEKNPTVKSGVNGNVLAIVGDFENRFQWGFAKNIESQIIEYGDPDNSGVDLKGHNQIYIRAEAYLGWAVIDKEAFSVVTQKATE